MESLIRQILVFWFGEDTSPEAVNNRKNFWFVASLDIDNQIRTDYKQYVDLAIAGQYTDWCDTARGRLAFILLLDQFTRNIYRKDKRAFDGDALAREVCKQGIQLGHDRELSILERSFYYMPLEHSESLDDQTLALEQFTQLVEDSPDEYRLLAIDSLKYAQLHYDIIKRFGRFPHRNNILNRASTEAEVRYLNDSAVNFGQ